MEGKPLVGIVSDDLFQNGARAHFTSDGLPTRSAGCLCYGKALRGGLGRLIGGMVACMARFWRSEGVKVIVGAG